MRPSIPRSSIYHDGTGGLTARRSPSPITLHDGTGGDQFSSNRCPARRSPSSTYHDGTCHLNSGEFSDK